MPPSFHLMPAAKMPAPNAALVTPLRGPPHLPRMATRGFADGGSIGLGGTGDTAPPIIPDIPFFAGGMIPGSGAGRTDRLPLSVQSESHVIPADVVSALGQGTSAHGARVLHGVLGGGTGPWNTPIPHASIGHHGPPRPPSAAGMLHQAQGGTAAPTSILAASGEFVVTPAEVWALGARAIRGGKGQKGETPMQAGHRLLDEMIGNVRKFQINWLKKAPPPKKSIGGAV